MNCHSCGQFLVSPPYCYNPLCGYSVPSVAPNTYIYSNPPAVTWTWSISPVNMNPIAKHTRIYVYEDDAEIQFEGVVEIGIKKHDDRGDSHRLRLEDDELVYVASGWLAIRFPGLKQWTL